MGYRKKYLEFVQKFKDAVINAYGKRLISFAVFGSVATDTFRPDSDIDCLVVAEDLPKGRFARMIEFENQVENQFEDDLKKLREESIFPLLSPIFKTPQEVKLGSPLFLDMTEAIKIYYDKNDFLKAYLISLSKRLKKLGAQKVFFKGGYYWILKPDFKPGEIIEL